MIARARVGKAIATAILVTVATGCDTHPPSAAEPPPNTGSATAAPNPQPGVASRIDPRWMGLGTGPGWNWQVISRTIARDSQTFNVRPFDDTDEFGPNYSGCGCGPATTAVLTVYFPGTFDPTDALAGQPVSVNGVEGFFRPAEGNEKSELTWQYAASAWATLTGRTTTTSTLDRLLELAADLRPAERTPARLPLRLAKLPADMPLSSIRLQSGQFPASVSFDACRRPSHDVPAPDCANATSMLNIEIWPQDDYPEFRSENGMRRELYSIPVKIGGRDGHLHERGNAAAVKVQPGMLVVFTLSGASTTRIEDVIAEVTWAVNPADEATWPVVADWTK